MEPRSSWIGIATQIQAQNVLPVRTAGHKFDVAVAKGNIPTVSAMVIDWIGNIIARALVTAIPVEKHPGARSSGAEALVRTAIRIIWRIAVNPSGDVRSRFARVGPVSARAVAPPAEYLVTRSGTLLAQSKGLQIV